MLTWKRSISFEFVGGTEYGGSFAEEAEQLMGIASVEYSGTLGRNRRTAYGNRNKMECQKFRDVKLP